MNVFEQITDEILVKKAQEGNEQAYNELFTKYKSTVLSQTRTYFLVGGDSDDLVQEGFFGLVKAIRDFRFDGDASFRSFAGVCIKRQILTAVKSATRQKHIPLNSYVSLSRSIYDDDSDGRTYIEALDISDALNPEEIFLINESYKGINKTLITVLSKFEKQILKYYLQGKSYTEISDIINRPTKSIDNALQRIKKKLEKEYKKLNG